MNNIKKIIDFLRNDLWRIPLNELSPYRSFLYKQLKIIYLSIKGFIEDKIQLRASALTLFSLLSIVPVLAVAFGIAKGFGFENRLNEQLSTAFTTEDQKVVLEQVIKFANNMLENTKGGLIAGIGIIFLFWSVMKLLGHIESAFNQIWQIKRSRTFFRKFADYFSFMLFAPILMLLSSGFTVFMGKLTGDIELLSYISPFLFKIFPYVVIWLLFTLVYMMMPNTKVTFKSAFLAGIVAGTVFQLVQWGYVNFQGALSRYGTIYGSFAALPLFILWLQISWIIVLFGAEVSFANQNIDKFEYESESLHISNYYKKTLTLYVAHIVIKNFISGGKTFTAEDIAHKLRLPIRIVREILYDLTETGIFSETVKDSYKETGYQPAKDINKLSISYILEKIDKKGSSDLDIETSKKLKKLTEIQDKFSQLIKKSNENKLLKDV